MNKSELKAWCTGYRVLQGSIEIYMERAWDYLIRDAPYNDTPPSLLYFYLGYQDAQRRLRMRTITLKDGREIEISQESYDALVAVANEEWPWKPKKNDRFFILWPDGEINHHVWNGHDLDQKYMAGGNAFRTRAEAMVAGQRRRAKKKIRDHAGNQNWIDWNEMAQLKWCVCYDNSDCEFRPQGCQVFDLGMVCYYRTEDDANAAICVMMDEYKTLFRVK